MYLVFKAVKSTDPLGEGTSSATERGIPAPSFQDMQAMPLEHCALLQEQFWGGVRDTNFVSKHFFCSIKNILIKPFVENVQNTIFIHVNYIFFQTDVQTELELADVHAKCYTKRKNPFKRWKSRLGGGGTKRFFPNSKKGIYSLVAIVCLYFYLIKKKL